MGRRVRRRYGGGGRGDYIPITTLSPPEWLLHWDGQWWEPFSCFIDCEGQSQKTISPDHNCWRERRAKVDLNWGPSAYQPNTFSLGQTGSRHWLCVLGVIEFMWPSPMKPGLPLSRPGCWVRCQEWQFPNEQAHGPLSLHLAYCGSGK